MLAVASRRDGLRDDTGDGAAYGVELVLEDAAIAATGFGMSTILGGGLMVGLDLLSSESGPAELVE